MLPEFIRGVINLRGSVVPVVDLAAFFHGKVSQPGKRSCIVMVEVRDDEEIQCVGVVVESVSAVIEIAAGDIEPAPAFGARINTDFIHGMGKVNDRFVIVLDVGRVLGSNSLGLTAQVEHILSGDALQWRIQGLCENHKSFFYEQSTDRGISGLLRAVVHITDFPRIAMQAQQICIYTV
jgi:chemotaxis signal transduction protein